MPKITGKTVYVLGAGASVHANAPLLNDFLVEARIHTQEKNTLKHQKSFDDVFNWVDGLRGSSYYVEFNLDNLEHIFSLAEMGKQLGDPNSTKLTEQLRDVISETLDRCKLVVKANAPVGDGTYTSFSSILKKQNDDRKNRTGASGTFELDSVITFNYDVLLDYAAPQGGIATQYCLDGKKAAHKFPLLKLHGSLNWVTCKACKAASKDGFQVVPPSPVAAGQTAKPFLKSGEYRFNFVSGTLANTQCQKCQSIGSYDSYLIPPTWAKHIEGTRLAPVWKTAIEEIRNAFQIIIIGYSMPPTDTFLQYLMTLALKENSELKRIVIVNPGEGVRARYEDVFSRSMALRNQLVHKDWKFDHFVQGMDRFQEVVIPV